MKERRAEGTVPEGLEQEGQVEEQSEGGRWELSGAGGSPSQWGIGRGMIQTPRSPSKDFTLYSKNNAKPSKNSEQEKNKILVFSKLPGYSAETETRED